MLGTCFTYLLLIIILLLSRLQRWRESKGYGERVRGREREGGKNIQKARLMKTALHEGHLNAHLLSMQLCSPPTVSYIEIFSQGQNETGLSLSCRTHPVTPFNLFLARCVYYNRGGWRSVGLLWGVSAIALYLRHQTAEWRAGGGGSGDGEGRG